MSECKVETCHRVADDFGRGLCATHHALWKKNTPVVERDPEVQAVHDRHPNIKQKPLPGVAP